MSQVSIDKLSKKNQEFIRIATHQLIEAGKTDEEIKVLLEEIIPTILENQSKGITARGLYGSPTAWVQQLTAAEKKAAENPAQNDDPRLMILDSALLIFGLLSIFQGAVNYFAKTPNPYGFTTLVLGSLTGGLVFYSLYHFIYRYYEPDQEYGTKPPFWKSAIVMSGAVLLWLVAFTLSAFLPSFLNPHLPNLLVIMIGGLALVGRWYLKKKFNIKSATANPRRY